VDIDRSSFRYVERKTTHGNTAASSRPSDFSPVLGGPLYQLFRRAHPTGMLAVNIGDAKTHKLLWLGSETDTLSDNPDQNTKKLNKALEKIFKKYPPP
jgi:hypothetical protein